MNYLLTTENVNYLFIGYDFIWLIVNLNSKCRLIANLLIRNGIEHRLDSIG